MKIANALAYAQPFEAKNALAAMQAPSQNALSGPAGMEQAAALSLAAKNVGMTEQDQADALSEYMANGGVNLDPQVTAWCAAFVNATLQQSGMKGTGSNMARSFLDWGSGVDQPQPGDIGVLPRGAPDSGLGHVGFVDRVNPDGTIRLLSGNAGPNGAVNYQNYPANAFLGFRRG